MTWQSAIRTSILVVVLLASACGEGQEKGIEALREQFRKDMATWRLPLDNYAPALTRQSVIWNNAENLVIAKCLEVEGLAGFPTDIPVPPESGARGGRRLLTINSAREHGYTWPGSSDPNKERQRQEYEKKSEGWYTLVDSTPGAQELVSECQDKMRSDQDRPSDVLDHVNFVSSLRSAAADKVYADSEVRAAIARWHECMEPLGVTNLPRNPWSMPSDSVRQTLGIPIPKADTPPDPDAPTRPTVEEIEFAVHDAECRESTGFAETFYEAEVEAQFEQIEGNEDKLERAQAAYNKMVEWSEAVFAEYE